MQGKFLADTLHQFFQYRVITGWHLFAQFGAVFFAPGLFPVPRTSIQDHCYRLPDWWLTLKSASEYPSVQEAIRWHAGMRP
jgi:hypothetical protein